MSELKKDRLSKVLFDMAMAGADRGALVRPMQSGESSAVCVIMEGNAAVAEIGSKLLKLARSLGDAPTDEWMLHVNDEIGLKDLFATADSAPNGWFWSAFNFGQMNIVLAVFVREIEQVANICNQHGAPCSFDNTKAAPGYQIVEQ